MACRGFERPWDELDLTSHGERIKRELDQGGYWISGSDLEAMWLADVFSGVTPICLPPG